MTERLEAVVLNILRHNDTHDIVTLYTLERGRMACLRRRPASRRATSGAAFSAPLSVVEAHINFNPARELQTISKTAPLRLWHQIMADPQKCIISIFVSDLLSNMLRAAEADRYIYTYIMEAVGYLDATKKSIANFHIAFLAGLLPLLGIQPDFRSWRPDYWLDMREGRFSAVPPLHPDRLTPEETQFLPTLARINLRNMHLFRMSASRRREILEMMLRYCAIHIPFNPRLKSLSVMREIFDPFR